MSAATNSQDPLPSLLREWATWYKDLGAVGYDDATTLWRALQGPGGGAFRSSVPRGVDRLEVDRALQRLVDAMDTLRDDSDPKISEPVLMVQGLYVAGVEAVKEATGKSRAAIYNAVTVGEALIRREMKLRA